MTPSRERRGPREVLLVEDNPADTRLTTEILQAGAVPKRVRAVRDGDEALAFLRRQGRFATARRPDLVVLDLNLPGSDGRDVLAEIRGDPELHCVPVVVLTTSNAPQDVWRAYELHANCYIVKPVGLAAFTAVIQAIDRFWLSVVQLPDRH